MYFGFSAALLLKAAGPGRAHLCSRAQRSSLGQMATVSSERSELHKHLRQTRRLRQRAAKRYRDGQNAHGYIQDLSMGRGTDLSFIQVKSLVELIPTAARLEEMPIDGDDGLVDAGYERCECSFAELRCVEMMFESRLMAIRDDTSKLKDIVERATADDTAFNLFALVPQHVDGLGQILDSWTAGLLAAADDLERGLLLWRSPDRELCRFYIGSSDDELGDAGGTQNEQSQIDELDYGDLVCLETDIETFSGCSFRRGSVGTVHAVHHCDELGWVEVLFVGALRCHGVSESSLRLLERASPLAGLQIVPD